MYIGFYYVMIVGVFVGIDDMVIFVVKKDIIDVVEVEVIEIQEQF